jgi:hypothetical protein
MTKKEQEDKRNLENQVHRLKLQIGRARAEKQLTEKAERDDGNYNILTRILGAKYKATMGDVRLGRPYNHDGGVAVDVVHDMYGIIDITWLWTPKECQNILKSQTEEHNRNARRLHRLRKK